MKNIKAKVIILCGGRGIRFKEETDNRPKPLVEVGSKPILWHIMKIYSSFGYKEFVLCLGYKGDMIKRFFLDYDIINSDFTLELGDRNKPCVHTAPDESQWKITMVDTGLQAMTGARIKKVEQFIDTDLFMLTYGDAVANIDIEKLVHFHRTHNKIGTITAVSPLSRFGELEIGKDGVVTAFREKAVMRGDYINGGFFVFDKRLFKYVNKDDGCIFEKEPLERLAADGQLAAFAHDGYWQCMDTYRDWQILDQDWESGHAQWKTWQK